MELFGPKSKNFFILSQKKVFLVFQERGLSEKVDLRIKNFRKKLPKCKKKKEPTLKKFLIFQEMKLSILKLKKLLHFKRELVKPENQEFLTFIFKHKCKIKNFLILCLMKKQNFTK